MSNKLDKKTLDKVRDIDGFPIGDDDDIINLSDPPHYTACPNPFLHEFIEKNSTQYDEKKDQYKVTPYVFDVSEGKRHPLYNIHAYHTKIPHQAIMRYILHYTNPGDLVYDGFCGTGMTGIASQLCAAPEPDFKKIIENTFPENKWGLRKTIMCDLSPMATFLSFNMNNLSQENSFASDAEKILSEIEDECDWMYKTQHTVDGQIQFNTNDSSNPVIGKINYTVWSDVYACSNCSEEVIFWDVAIKNNDIMDEFNCSSCNAALKKKDLERIWVTLKDVVLNQTIKQVKQIPVLINYSVKIGTKSKTFYKKPDKYDFKTLEKINDLQLTSWYPTQRMPEGRESRRNDKIGITHTHQFYTKRALLVLSKFFEKILKTNNPRCIFWFTSVWFWTSKINVLHVQNYFHKKGGSVGSPKGRLYIGSLSLETNVHYRLELKKSSFISNYVMSDSNYIISTQSSTKIPQIPNNSIDYIFTDPPFGSNIDYSELNFIQESWLKVFTNNKKEAIVNKSQKKGLVEYQELMEQCFKENYRILKPGRWMTIVFHNSQNKVWVAIQEALQRAGFVVADVRILDKKEGTMIQNTTKGAVKQDLTITSYKPSGGLEQYFGGLTNGTDEGVWKFMDTHLKQLPIFVKNDNIIEIITERQKFLLFDRMIAFHIQKGLSVPMSSSEFYEKLNQKYVERDGMYFLSEQISEYDQKRAQVKSVEQTTIFVEDEKSTILWLNEQLKTPQTYQEIQPIFRKQMHETKFEKLPELSEILEQNFLEDEKGMWHIPDPSKLKDLEKLREKSLLREFQTYVESKGKLKQFRLEAIRAGFKKKWSENNYQSIVDIANRLPDLIIQEDSSLLMYYDNASSRL